MLVEGVQRPPPTRPQPQQIYAPVPFEPNQTGVEAIAEYSADSDSDASRSASPNASEMAKWGVRNQDGTWSCTYPGCVSKSRFSRGCDLRKHYKRHTKSLFCRHEGCPQGSEGGFSSKKDRARHEAKHNAEILCEWEGCDRLFSRVDNMVRTEVGMNIAYRKANAQSQKDHVRRVHGRDTVHHPSYGSTGEGEIYAQIMTHLREQTPFVLGGWQSTFRPDERAVQVMLL